MPRCCFFHSSNQHNGNSFWTSALWGTKCSQHSSERVGGYRHSVCIGSEATAVILALQPTQHHYQHTVCCGGGSQPVTSLMPWTQFIWKIKLYCDKQYILHSGVLSNDSLNLTGKTRSFEITSQRENWHSFRKLNCFSHGFCPVTIMFLMDWSASVFIDSISSYTGFC